jgi:hypothetical protein
LRTLPDETTTLEERDLFGTQTPRELIALYLFALEGIAKQLTAPCSN